MKLKNRKLVIIALIVSILILPFIVNEIGLFMNSKLIDSLQGEIYYTKRINGSSALYKSKANLKNEKLIYSNAGKGGLEAGFNNDNIGDFRFFPETKELEFEAVYKGSWRILKIKEGETEPTYLREIKEVKGVDDYRIVELDTAYISRKYADIEVYDRKGALYIKRNGQEKCIKKFWGTYSEKFTGYRVMGLSPDGKYLVYSYLGAFLGTMIDEREQYIMELETGKCTKYKRSFSYIQWVAE